MKTYGFAGLAATIAIVPLAIVTSAVAAATTQSDDATMTRLAVTVLSDASAARVALARKQSGAQEDIRRALTADRALASEARAAGLSEVVPIYAEFDDAAVLSDAVKRKSSTAPATTVRANSADLTYLAIDLDAASSRLRAAQTAIRNGNDRAARDSLAAVGSDLVEESVLTDLPLLTAREDLARAQRELKTDDRAAAVADLQQASRSLTAYSNSDHIRGARLLAAQIDTDIAAGAMRPSSLDDRVAHWWTSVKNWFVRRA